MSNFALLSASVLLFYLIQFVVDKYLRAKWSYTYAKFVNSTGLNFSSYFQISWRTQIFNRIFAKVGNSNRCLKSFWEIWFTAGAVVATLLVFPAMVLLVNTLVGSAFSSPDQDKSDRITLQPVLPGVNMPMSELGYYFVTLLVCSVIHEAGHALAATNENVRLLGFGMFLVLVFPAAFVDLPTDQIISLKPFKQLKVFAAGVWHNVVLALLSYLILFSLPLLLTPFYETGTGVTVASVVQDSVVTGPTGLEYEDEIVSINDCEIRDKLSWKKCLSESIVNPVTSLCLTQQDLTFLDPSYGKRTLDSNSNDCCDQHEMKSSVCFEVMNNLNNNSYNCLPVRSALERATSKCSWTCQQKQQLCVRPLLENNSSRLLQLKRRAKIDFLFVGNPAELYVSVQVSDFRPNFEFVSAKWPNRLELFCHYLATFSGGLAVLNVVPCFLLDGQHMIRVLVDIFCHRREQLIKSVLIWTFNILGTLLLICNIILGIWHLF